MADIAQLSYSVDTRQLEKASRLLDDLAVDFEDVNNAKIRPKGLNTLSGELDSVSKSGNRASRSASSMSSSFGLLSRTIPAISFGALAASAVSLSRDFESSMLNVQSKLGITGEAMEALEEQALKLGSTTSFSARQAGDAMGYLAQAGLDQNAIMQSMPSLLNLAAAANMDLARAADIVANSMGGFGLAATETTKVTDIMVNASNKSNQSIEELGLAFKVVGGLAKNVGLGMDDVAAAAGHLANKGTKGAEAGTALRNMLSILINPAGDAKKALDELGLSSSDFYDTTEDGKQIFKGYPSMIDTFTKAGVNASDMMRIFGAENGNAALNMLDGADAIRELTTQVNVNGSASEAAKLKTSGLDGAFKSLGSAWEGAQLAMMNGEGTGLATDGINALAGVVSALPSIFTEVGKYFDAFTDRIDELSLGLSDFMTTVSESAFGEMASDISQATARAGVMAAQGLVEGLRRGKEMITGASKEIAKSVPDAVKSELDIRSPSRVLMAQGMFVGEGFAIGIDQSGGKVSKSAKKMADAATAEFDRITEGLTKQYLKMTQGDEAARRYELSMGKMTASQQESVLQTERLLKNLEEEQRKQKEAARATEQAEKVRQRELEATAKARQKATQSVADSRKELEKARIEQRGNTEEIELFNLKARETELTLTDGYNPALAREQALNEQAAKAVRAHTADLKKQEASAKRLADGVAALEKKQIIQNIALTDGAAAAREAELALEGYDKQTAAYMTTVESNIELQKDFHGALVDSISNADSVKDVFQSMGDWMKEWLEEKIVHFAANKIMTYVGMGDGGMPNIAGMAGGGSSAAGSGNMMATLQQGGMGGAMMAGGLGMMAGQMMGQTGAGAGAGAAIGNAIAPVIGGVIGAALGGIFESAFGGSKQKVGSGFQVEYSTESGLSGQSFDKYEKEKSLWRGTKKWKEYSELDGDIEKSVSNYFGNLNEAVNDQARVLGFESINNILKGFSVSSEEMEGQNAEEQLATWIETSTIKAYKMAYDNIDPYIQQAIGNSLEVFGRYAEFSEYLGMTTKEIMATGKSAGDAFYIFRMLNWGLEETGMTAEEVAARFEFVSDVAMRVTPTLEALGWQVGDSFGKMVLSSTMLVEAIGTTDQAMQRLTYYTNNFVPAAEVAQTMLNSATDSLTGWNDTLGLSGEAAIDTRAEFKTYIESLDLTTEAGIAATAAALEQMEALVLVADANLLMSANLTSVSEAARNLNLNFDATSPLAGAAASSLVDLMGGLEQFTSATRTYYDLFYDENEKHQLGLAQAAQAVKAYNDMMGISEGATIDSSKEFRALVESLDLNTESGREAYAASMDVAKSMALISDEGKTLDEVIGALPDDLTGAFELMKTATATSATNIEDYAEVATKAIDDTSLSISDLSGAVSGLDKSASKAAEKERQRQRDVEQSRRQAEAKAARDRKEAERLQERKAQTEKKELASIRDAIEKMNREQQAMHRVSIEQRNALIAENQQLKKSVESGNRNIERKVRA